MNGGVFAHIAVEVASVVPPVNPGGPGESRKKHAEGKEPPIAVIIFGQKKEFAICYPLLRGQ